MAAAPAPTKPITPLDFMTAANHGDLATVKKYVEQGGNVNVRVPLWEGRTALFDAAYFNYREMVEYLLKNGANPTLYPRSGFEGDSVLHHLVERDYPPEIIKIVLERGGDPNRLSQITGETPVTEAKSPLVLELLLKHGGNPNAQARYHMMKADELAQSIANLEAQPRPLPEFFQDLWNKHTRMLELLCVHGSTSASCQEYRAKMNLLHQKTQNLTGKPLPENVAKNILRIGRGGSRRALRKKSRCRRVARKATRTRR